MQSRTTVVSGANGHSQSVRSGTGAGVLVDEEAIARTVVSAVPRACTAGLRLLHDHDCTYNLMYTIIIETIVRVIIMIVFGTYLALELRTTPPRHTTLFAVQY